MISIPIPSRALLALLVACALVLTACGDKEANGGDAGGTKDPSKGATPEAGGSGPKSPADDEHAGHDHGPGQHGETPVTPKADNANSANAQAPQPPPPIQELPEFKFDPPLPSTAIAHVNDKPVPAADLLKYVLGQNFSAGANALVLAKIMDREILKEKVEITEECDCGGNVVEDGF